MTSVYNILTVMYQDNGETDACSLTSECMLKFNVKCISVYLKFDLLRRMKKLT